MDNPFDTFQFDNYFILNDQIRSKTILENNTIVMNRYLYLSFSSKPYPAKPVIKNFL